METDLDQRYGARIAGDAFLDFLAVVVDPTQGWPQPGSGARSAVTSRLAPSLVGRAALALSAMLRSRRGFVPRSWKLEA